MNVSLYQAASAMNANSRWQEVISENLASSSIPGFKKQQLSVEAVQAGLMPTGGSAKNAHYFMVPKATATTSFLPGDVQATGNKNDVAIEGKGFLEVQLPTGQTALTRDGEFQMNSHGQLVTKEGFSVMGDGGPIQLDLNNSTQMSISSSGEISQGADQKGKLKIVDVDKPELLKALSGGFFLADNPAVHTSGSTTSTVRQGCLEGSNTSVVNEMANMMTAMRSFEANQKVVQIQDDRLGKVVSELGNPN